MTAPAMDHTSTLEQEAPRPASRPAPAPIPFTRLLSVETIKMFNTRAGFWLMVGMAAAAVVATASVILFAPDDQIVYDNFGAAIGIPMTLLLPVMAILAIPGCLTIAAPSEAPGPVRQLTAPAGSPPSASAAQNASGASGVTLGGLTTAVQPVPSAGPSFHPSNDTG